MPEHDLNKTERLSCLPLETNKDYMDKICGKVAQCDSKIVVLDDDPTGTQTVHGIPVLTTWDVGSIKQELENKGSAFFILTNSRALTRDKAIAQGQKIGQNLFQASCQTKIDITVISRSDSTLRGHFPYEVDAVAQTLHEDGLPYLICPFFLEGGRLTIDDIHYVAEGDQMIPAARTPYAMDATFGFENSDLKYWVAEKTRGRISADAVISITLDDIRKGGPEQVAQKLLAVPGQGACIVNAVSYKDIEVLVMGLLAAENHGKRFLHRTAASFVRVRCGVIAKKTFLSGTDLTSGAKTGGLFVVGSYVPKTTNQLSDLQTHTDIVSVEIDVKKILNREFYDLEVGRVASEANTSLEQGKDTLIFTSRELIVSDDSEKSREIGQVVSQSLIEIVRKIRVQPRYLVAKGGITSSDVATRGLGVKRAMVEGQVLPGVPVWKLGEDAVYPGMPYIVFPGNVGADDALTVLKKQLEYKSQVTPC